MTDKTLTQVLIVDDEVSIQSAVARSLYGLPLQLHFASSGTDALQLCRQQAFDIVISDQRMPQMTGTELMTELCTIQPHALRIILSAYADFDDIIKGFNEGLIQRFITKPWSEAELLSVFNIAEKKPTPAPSAEFHSIMSVSTNMQTLFSKITKAARANVPVFVCGESGSGKELAARALHEESARKAQPYVAFNCANFNDSLIESQLFGHVKGSFTGASSDTSGLFDTVGAGTLFLDEITSMPLSLQAKLLRVLQEREYSPVGSHKTKPFLGQVICASNQSLRKAVENDCFREDLRYRLEVILLEIPSLRQRPDDIEYLLRHFLKQASPERSFVIDQQALQLLNSYPWPGNIRQLQNTALYLAAMVDGEKITKEDLADEIISTKTANDSDALFTQKTLPAPTPNSLSNLTTVEAVLTNCNGNKSEAARQLGVSRMTLWRHLKRLNLIS
mgnify:CR=1 FL=1